MSPCVSPTNVNMFRCSRTSQKGCFLVVFKSEKDNTPSKKKMLVLNLKINWQQPTMANFAAGESAAKAMRESREALDLQLTGESSKMPS